MLKTDPLFVLFLIGILVTLAILWLIAFWPTKEKPRVETKTLDELRRRHAQEMENLRRQMDVEKQWEHLKSTTR